MLIRQSLLIITTAILCVMLSINSASAHTEHDKARFVAPTGQDTGRCDLAARPCASIRYAALNANKGDRILVAGGSYTLENADDLFYMASGLIKIETGYSRYDLFRQREPETNRVVLKGAPAEYRTLLEPLGIHIIADGKVSLGRDELHQSEKMLADVRAMAVAKSAADCVSGQTESLPCNSVGLLSHSPLGSFSSNPSRANDIWGFVDLNTDREYVLLGLNNAVAVVDVTDPENPVEIASFPGRSTVWRDVKVLQRFDAAAGRYNAYAYVTADDADERLRVIDLRGLPNSASLAATSGDFQAAHNVYLAGADYATGLANSTSEPSLQIGGANIGGGVFRSYNLTNPLAPTLISASGSGYMHDATSLTITDARKDTQCAASGPECQLLADFNENTVDIWDITANGSPTRLSSTPYANASYTHSGWWSEDRRFLFVHDELDEQQRGLNTTLRVFSLDNLAAPALTGTWTGPTRAIDHNGFVRGNRYYMSNYTRGLTILDISDPGNPADIGFLDTFAPSDANSFSGAWGVFPFLPSGTLAISDIDSGLYLARDDSLNVAAGSLALGTDSISAIEGSDLLVRVDRLGGNSGAVSVGVEFVAASADSSDLALTAARLDWTDGDSQTKTLIIPVANDGAAEGLEQLLVRLVDPQGGATLGQRSVVSAWLTDPGASATVSFMSAGETLSESTRQAVFVVLRGGSAEDAVSVDFATSGDATMSSDINGSSSGSLSWNDGDASPRTLVYTISDDNNDEPNETLTLTLSNPSGAAIGSNATSTLTISDNDSAPPVTPPPVTGGGNNSGGGGGSPAPLVLIALCVLWLRRQRQAT